MASAVYYKYVITSVSITNPPVSIEEVQSQYVNNFMNGPTGLYVSISISKSEMISINNTEAINITLAKLIIMHQSEVRLDLGVQEPAQLLLMIVNSSNALIATYPNNTIISLNPGDYLIIEELKLPINFTGTVTISGTYAVIIKGVEFVYDINENVNVTN